MVFIYLIWFLQQTDIYNSNELIFVVNVLCVFCELLNWFQNAFYTQSCFKMLNYRPNGRRGFGRPLKRLSDEAETSLSRPNSRRMMTLIVSSCPSLLGIPSGLFPWCFVTNALHVFFLFNEITLLDLSICFALICPPQQYEMKSPAQFLTLITMKIFHSFTSQLVQPQHFLHWLLNCILSALQHNKIPSFV